MLHKLSEIPTRRQWKEVNVDDITTILIGLWKFLQSALLLEHSKFSIYFVTWFLEE